MQDTYGDGWNGAILKVFVNGALKGEFYGRGFGSSETFEVCPNDVIRLTYSSGDYEEENIYKIYDAGWNIFFQDGPNPKVGNVTSLTATCGAVAIPGKHPCVALPTEKNIEIEGTNQDFIGSGLQASNCPNFEGGDMWYTTQQISSGNMEVSISQLGDVVAGYAVWQGEDCTNLKMVQCSNTDNEERKATIKIYDIPKGQTVFVQVWGSNNQTAQFTLSWKDLGRIILDGSDLPVVSVNTLGQNIPYGDKSRKIILFQ